MSDLIPTPADTATSPDVRRAAATQALEAAVLEWLRANQQIPENREVVAVDFAVPFTAKWLTRNGRPARRGGTIVPPDGPDLGSLGDMMLRRAQQVRDPLYGIDRLDVDYSAQRPTTRHQYLPGCVADHSRDPIERQRCWVQIGSGYSQMGGGSSSADAPSIELWAHQVTTPAGTESRVRLQLVNHRTGAKMAADMPPYWAHYMVDDVAQAAEQLIWAERAK